MNEVKATSRFQACEESIAPTGMDGVPAHMRNLQSWRYFWRETHRPAGDPAQPREVPFVASCREELGPEAYAQEGNPLFYYAFREKRLQAERGKLAHAVVVCAHAG